MSPEWIIGTLVTLVIAGVPGIYRLSRDLRTARKEALAEAEERGRKEARLEAVAESAQAALTAKNAELEAIKAELYDCWAAKGGGP